MKVGYARTSTLEQQAGLEGQIRDLKAQGCEKIFHEHCSAVGERPELEKALEYVREGDEFVVTQLDRLARNVQHLLEMVDRLKEKNVTMKILSMDLDTSKPHGRLVLTMLGTIAEWERKIMLERQREGIEKAIRDGKYKGRPPIPAEIKAAVLRHVGTGVTKSWIAKQLKIGISTVYRIIQESKAANA